MDTYTQRETHWTHFAERKETAGEVCVVTTAVVDQSVACAILGQVNYDLGQRRTKNLLHPLTVQIV